MENSTFYPVNDYRYLAHHGVKGMKWGIRHDPYAKYRKNPGKYERTNKVLQKMDASKPGSLEYNKYKKSLKKAASYDRGKDLYSKGASLGSINSRLGLGRSLAGTAAASAFLYTPMTNVNFKWHGKSIGSIPMNVLEAGTIAAGYALLETITGDRRKQRDLRQYYAGYKVPN